MMLRLQKERMSRWPRPLRRASIFRFFGLDAAKLSVAKPDAIVMHPGPDEPRRRDRQRRRRRPQRSVIGEQVEMGVAVRMAVLDILSRDLRRNSRA
jgi:aspartate carbamoyltransferase catalytic subunit